VIDEFLTSLLEFVTSVITPDVPESDEALVRDDSDRVVLRGARTGRSDLLVTGDKDLLEAGIEDPAVITPADYLRRFSED